MTGRCSCRRCDGSGYVLLLNSWFTSDGYRRERCGICGGSGKNPPGYTAWPGDAAFREKALANIKAWGGMKPTDRASVLPHPKAGGLQDERGVR